MFVSGAELADEVYAAILEALPFGICFTDVSGRIRCWNATAEQISGYSAAEAMSAREAGAILRFIDDPGRPEDTTPSQRVLLRHREGYPTLVERLRIPLQRADASALGMLDVFSLTDDPDSVPATGETPSILALEVDEFDRIVSRFGVEAAEKVVVVVDKTLAVCVQPGDGVTSEGHHRRVVRLNGRDAAMVGSRMQALLQGASVPWWGSDIRFTVSISTEQA